MTSWKSGPFAWNGAILALAVAGMAQAQSIPWPPPGQNVDKYGPKATYQSRQRLKLLQRLFPGATDYPRDVCHFALPVTPERPDPAYRARNLLFVCVDGDETVFIGWPARAR